MTSNFEGRVIVKDDSQANFERRVIVKPTLRGGG